jgi:hypothetical protein
MSNKLRLRSRSHGVVTDSCKMSLPARTRMLQHIYVLSKRARGCSRARSANGCVTTAFARTDQMIRTVDRNSCACCVSG